MMKTILLYIFILWATLVDGQQALPEGNSYFGQIAYNRPVDYKHTTETGLFTSRFKSGFSGAVGFTRYKKIIFTALIKYTYTTGKSYGEDHFHVGSTKYTSQFYLGRLSGEVIFRGFLTKRKKLSMGGGVLFGSCIYKNISGTYTEPTTSAAYYTQYGPVFPDKTEPLTNDFFGTNYYGLLVDINYKFNGPSGSSMSLGLKTGLVYRIMPKVNKFLESEIYFAYNFLNKKSGGKTKQNKDPVNWNNQNDY